MLVLVDAAQIEVGIAAGLIARGHHGFLEPGNRVVPFPLFNQISPDIVVRIAEVGIYLDGFQTFGDGAVVIAEQGVGPAAEGVRLSGREGGDRTSVEFDGWLDGTCPLQLVGLLEVLGGGLATIGVGHERIQ